MQRKGFIADTWDRQRETKCQVSDAHVLDSLVISRIICSRVHANCSLLHQFCRLSAILYIHGRSTGKCHMNITRNTQVMSHNYFSSKDLLYYPCVILTYSLRLPSLKNFPRASDASQTFTSSQRHFIFLALQIFTIRFFFAAELSFIINNFYCRYRDAIPECAEAALAATGDEHWTRDGAGAKRHQSDGGRE